MKRTIAIMAAGVFCLSVATASAQETWDPRKNPTVDSIISKHKDNVVPMPPALTIDKIFPVLGQYESAVNTDAAAVTITLDNENKGIIWVEGLPQGKIKAILLKSPSTYKIPAQKTADEKEVAEGTLVFDKETNTLSICIGKPYNSADPMTAFAAEPATEEVVPAATVKSKTKVKPVEKPKPWMYAGTKVETETASN